MVNGSAVYALIVPTMTVASEVGCVGITGDTGQVVRCAS